MRKKNNIVWITGASSGIGKALVAEFAKNNVYVLGSARRLNLLNEIKKELGKQGKYFIPHKLDVTDFPGAKAKYSEISKHYRIECLINNAGITSFSLASKDNSNTVEKVVRTNLIAPINISQLVLKGMRRRKEGTIINILSVAAEKVFVRSSVYSAAKAGLLAYMKVLREEIREYNVKIVNVLPGATKTGIWPRDMLKKSGDRMMLPGDIAKLIYLIYNMNSSAVPEEIVLRPIQGDL